MKLAPRRDRSPRLFRTLAAAGFMLLAAGVHAQAYPGKPIRMMVPFPAGGGSDTMGRALAQKLAERFGQPVVVENRPGAGGSIGAEFVARSAPDGYTILLGSTSELVQYPNVNPQIRYDPLRDFAPITLVGTVPLVMVVHPSLPAQSVKALVALTKARPGEVNFSSAGNGSTTHLAVELFILMTGARMTHVPYKGSPQAVTDLVAGNVQVGIPTMPAALPFIKAGRVRALGVTSGKRAAVLPDVPTLHEAGVTGYETDLWTGILAPAGTPAAVLSRLHAEIVHVSGMQDLRQTLARQGAIPATGTPEEFSAYMRAELQKWARVVHEAKVRPN
jgi:tripartite-type tricarboxylate transporter receptor subunit TctC